MAIDMYWQLLSALIFRTIIVLFNTQTDTCIKYKAGPKACIIFNGFSAVYGATVK